MLLWRRERKFLHTRDVSLARRINLPPKLQMHNPALTFQGKQQATSKMADEFEMPIFAFHNLNYVPSGYGDKLAPYIETGPGTMRAAATLMGLDLAVSTQQVVCDLGCGEGEFLIGLLKHINAISRQATATTSPILGVGVDYNAEMIAVATTNAVSEGESVKWLTYDFNLDKSDLVGQLNILHVTHVFVYLVPKQLALDTVRGILTKLQENGIVICCHKFQPTYLTAVKRDVLMDLVLY